jgi:DNA-binding transcriptional ArsR family regulator
MSPKCCPSPEPLDSALDRNEEIARLAKALGHPARVQIIRFLLGREECMAGAIADELPLAQSTVSQHLKVLREAGLINGEVDGARICYCADSARIERLGDLLSGLLGVARVWEETAMTELKVFDPALCCSTGVCGPEVNDALVRFAADLEWLRGLGVAVRRYNLAQEAGAFAGDAVVRQALQREGTDCLPLVLAGGAIVARGRYPSRDELLGWSGVDRRVPTAAGADTSEAASGSQADGACCAPGLVSVGGSSGCC